VSPFQERFFTLAARFPRLRRGGLNRKELEDLARRVGRRLGKEVRVRYRPWPWPASVQPAGGSVTIVVDSDRPPAQRVISLAHEVGHLALGHYALDDFWTDSEGSQSLLEEMEADLFAAIVLDRHRTPIQYLGGPEQMELLR